MSREIWRDVPWWWVLAIVGFVVLAGGMGVYRQTRTLTAQRATIARLAAENGDLRYRLEHAAANPPVQTGAAPAPESRGAVPTRPSEAAPAGGAGHAEEAAIQSLRDRLAESDAARAKWQAHVTELEAQVRNLEDANQRLTASETDLSGKLASADKTLDTVQSELKAKQERLAGIEGDNARLRAASAESARKWSQARQMAGQLQDLQRRRETYLNSLLRRYKDITDQYRALAVVIDSRRQQEGAAPGGLDLTRIQNTISMAEDDLRQVNNLSAQAARVEREMQGK